MFDYYWQSFLLILVALLPLGVFLRWYAENTLGVSVNWVKNDKLVFKKLKDEGRAVWILLNIEGLISNVALVGLIISIPMYFLWGL